ncbi:MAG: radical SAM protein, partial [Deltaproteobacteria bacterium]|nr:radical SAM protein [Deltaproteobacteria bacterium]
ISILASRGCYNYCSFCPVPSFYNNGPLWRGRTPENIINEISYLYDQGSRDFYFIDPNFIGPGTKGRQRVFELAEHIGKLGITYGIETRPNDLDSSIMICMVSSGLNSLLMGIESGSADILDGMGKHTSREISEKAIELCRSSGLEPEVGFLMFVPDSTIEDIERNFAFLKSNILLDRLDRTVNLLSHYQIVLMGTPGYQSFENKGRLVKQGLLGFEGDIVYRSRKVKWLRDVIIDICRYILQVISEKTSPVYWGRQNQTKKRELNDFIVDLFAEMLKDAKNLKSLPLIPDLTSELKKGIKAMLEKWLLQKKSSA